MKKQSLSLLALLLTFVIAFAQEPPPKNTSIPSTLAVTYYAQPANRVALRDSMVHSGLRQFEKWKTEGLLKDYRILFSSYLDTDTPTMTVLLNFSSSAAATRWMTIEDSMPGGLTREALSLVASSQTAQMDHIFHGGVSSNPAREESVFMVIPYEFFVSAPEYQKYMQDYGLPQFDGWLKENVLVSYDIYQNRYSASKPWGSLIVFEYRNAEALGRREAVMAKVRTSLQSNAAWKAISDNKHKIREEREAFIAQELPIH
jgi:hypothetical protein